MAIYDATAYIQTETLCISFIFNRQYIRGLNNNFDALSACDECGTDFCYWIINENMYANVNEIQVFVGECLEDLNAYYWVYNHIIVNWVLRMYRLIR